MAIQPSETNESGLRSETTIRGAGKPSSSRTVSQPVFLGDERPRSLTWKTERGAADEADVIQYVRAEKLPAAPPDWKPQSAAGPWHGGRPCQRGSTACREGLCERSQPSTHPLFIDTGSLGHHLGALQCTELSSLETEHRLLHARELQTAVVWKCWR